jgi:hypothetical protein
LEYITAIWYILLPFGLPILWPFGNLEAIWYVFPRFGILCQEKSGNPVCRHFIRLRATAGEPFFS